MGNINYSQLFIKTINAGRSAFTICGDNLKDCPHKPDNHLWALWQKGWAEAYDEYCLEKPWSA